MRIVASILFTLAISKFMSAAGASRVLDYDDPVLGLSNREVMLFSGSVECLICYYIVKPVALLNKGVALLWLGGNFLLYRAAFVVIAPGKYCACAGSITAWLPLSSESINTIFTSLAAAILLTGFIVAWSALKNNASTKQ